MEASGSNSPVNSANGGGGSSIKLEEVHENPSELNGEPNVESTDKEEKRKKKKKKVWFSVSSRTLKQFYILFFILYLYVSF